MVPSNFRIKILTILILLCALGSKGLKWSARVAQFLFNQACQFSPYWLTGCAPQRRTLIGCLFQPIIVPQASCTLGGCFSNTSSFFLNLRLIILFLEFILWRYCMEDVFLIHSPSNWFSHRVLNWQPPAWYPRMKDEILSMNHNITLKNRKKQNCFS